MFVCVCVCVLVKNAYGELVAIEKGTLGLPFTTVSNFTFTFTVSLSPFSLAIYVYIYISVCMCVCPIPLPQKLFETWSIFMRSLTYSYLEFSF